MVECVISDSMPPLPEADFSFEIDFKRGSGSASRVFLATHEFIKACESFDADLLKCIDSNIQPIMTLEDVRAGSIKTFLRNRLTSIDDGALRRLDWKLLVGNFLVDCKSIALQWLADCNEREPKASDLMNLRQEIQNCAKKTDVRHLPDYTAPSPETLVKALKKFQNAQSYLSPDDVARYITERNEIILHSGSIVPIEKLESLAVARTTTGTPQEMVFPVKKPDYLGDSKWELRHGKRNISARIEDVSWLEKFQSRAIDVRPGDALRCEMQIDYLYGFDNELISERYTVKRVIEVLTDRIPNAELELEDNAG